MEQTNSNYRQFGKKDIEEISSLGTELKYGPGEMVFAEGDEAACFYIVEQGQLSVFYNHNGQQKQLCILSDHDYFGEMAIYNQDKRSASVISLVESKLLEINKPDFMEFVEQDERRKEIIRHNLRVRNEELALRESLIDITGVHGKRMHVSIKGDPSLRESAFERKRYESVVDKDLEKLQPVLEDLLINRCVYRLFINFNSGEIRTATVFDPMVEEVHTSEKLVNPAYVERHFPRISYDKKSSLIKLLYQCLTCNNPYQELPGHYRDIIDKTHEQWQPIPEQEISNVMQRLTTLRSISNFYLRNFSISMVQDAIRMQFNCDGTHFVSTKEYDSFFQENVE